LGACYGTGFDSRRSGDTARMDGTEAVPPTKKTAQIPMTAAEDSALRSV
jgi:hypothetical protein